MPAQQTEIRRPLSAPAAASTAACTGSGSITFASTKLARSPSSPASALPFSALRSAITTEAPAACRACAVAAPRPEAPPTTSALAPSISTAREHMSVAGRAALREGRRRDSVACLHLGAGSAQHQGRDRTAIGGGPESDPRAARPAVRLGAQHGLLADPQPPRLGHGPHRELRGAVAGADRRREGATERRARPLLRRDRKPARDQERAAYPARRRAALLLRGRPGTGARRSRRGGPGIGRSAPVRRVRLRA